KRLNCASPFLVVAERRPDGSRGLESTEGVAREDFRRRSATRRLPTPGPWAEAHGYPHGLALRGNKTRRRLCPLIGLLFVCLLMSPTRVRAPEDPPGCC